MLIILKKLGKLLSFLLLLALSVTLFTGCTQEDAELALDVLNAVLETEVEEEVERIEEEKKLAEEKRLAEERAKQRSAIKYYNSGTLSVTIEPRLYDGLEYWITTVRVNSMSQVRSAFAWDTPVGYTKETVSSMASRHGAVLAINGAATGFNNVGYVIRDEQIIESTYEGEKIEPIKNDTIDSEFLIS